MNKIVGLLALSGSLICGCATQQRCLPDNMSGPVDAMDLTPEKAFSNALVAAKDAFPDFRVEANKEQALIAAIDEDGNHSITIEAVPIYSKSNISLKGILYDPRVRSSTAQTRAENQSELRSCCMSPEMRNASPKTFSPSPTYLVREFLAAYASRFCDVKTVSIEDPQVNRKTVAYPSGVKIALEVPLTKQDQEQGIDVLDISFEDALNLAYETALSAFTSSRVETSLERNCVKIIRDDLYHPTIMVIEPRIIQNLAAPEDYGVLYRYSLQDLSTGNSGLCSWQDQLKFEEEFWRKNMQHVVAKWIPSIRLSFDQGVPDRIASSIPTTYEGFKRYLDGRKGLLPFEGIWTEAEGMYTLGIVFVANDPRFKYHAFVIESRRSSWQPGEIKAKFSDLKVDRIATGEYRWGSKALFGMSWKVRRDILEGVSAILGQSILFIRTYPSRGGSDLLSGVGTAWAVTDKGVFITAAHVVEGASKLFVGFKDKNPQEATVLVLDQKLDLAIIKTKSEEVRYIPIPILSSSVANGTGVTTLGYPLAFDVGDDIKVTSGIISSQSGDRRDITTYQISAPVQAGNSGGPIIDKHGNAAGVVVAQINDEAVGTDAELVNYAVKSPYVQPLLDVAKVKAAKSQDEKEYSAQDIAEMYRESVLPVWTED